MRAREPRGSSERKATGRAVEGYRMICTNRPLRCGCRRLFSLAGVKKKLSLAQEKDNMERERHTQEMIERIYTGASNI